MGKNYNSSRLVNGLSVDASGNVGVGNSPNASYKLTVTGTSLYTGALTANNTINTYNSTGNYYLSFYDTSSSNKNWGIIARGNNIAIREAGVNDHMTFLAGGSVLIGTTSTAVGGILSLNGDLKFGGTAGGNYSIINYQGGYLAFGTDNAERMRITTAGNVGIGNAAPFNFGAGHKTLDVRGETTSSIGAIFAGNSDRTAVLGFYINPAATGTVGTSSNHALQLVTNDAERIRITSTGNVCIGTSTSSGYGNINLDLSSGALPAAYFVLKTNSGGVIAEYALDGGVAYLSTKSNHPLVFRTADVERMRISEVGNLQFHRRNTGAAYIEINQATNQDGGIVWTRNLTNRIQQTLNNSDGIQFYSYGISNTAFQINQNGSASLYGSLTQNASDRRLKNNIQNIPNALDKINAINGVTFEWDNTVYKTDKTNDVGVIAQEIQAVLPEAVTLAPFDTNYDGVSKSGENYLTVYYEKLIPLLVEGIKELKGENDELRSILTRNNLQ